ncbi:MAG: type 2 isopentenyl-diphosphate Delta-isomerase [Flexilinea sp.]
MSIISRKNDHISVCLTQNVQSDRTNGFEKYRLIHNALPEIDFENVKTETEFIGKKIAAPIIFSSMTGGTENGNQINRSLLEAAENLQIPFAFGSLRILIEEKSLGSFENPRKIAPTIPILANLGAVQLNYGFSLDQCLKTVEIVEGDALILHLNPLQEILQSSGNTDFSTLLEKIEKLCSDFPVPIIIKEVGWGISASTARKLADAGVYMIDVAGAGGTSWAKVEKEVSGSEETSDLASLFNDWGIQTAQCVDQIHREEPEIKLIASGGITNGLEVWKALLLGADLAGIARPLLEPASKGPAAVQEFTAGIIKQLRIAKFISNTIIKDDDR